VTMDQRSAEGDAQASRLSSFRQDAATGAYAVAAQRTGAGATFKLDRSASSLQAPRGDWEEAGLKSGCLIDRVGRVRGSTE